MKKYFLLLTITTKILSFTHASACPCEFSPNDARPFFEQYEEKEEKITPQPTDEKEKSCVK